MNNDADEARAWVERGMGPRLLEEVERQLLADLEHYGVKDEGLRIDWSHACGEGTTVDCLGGQMENYSSVGVDHANGEGVAGGDIGFLHSGAEDALFVFWHRLSVREADRFRDVKEGGGIPRHVWDRMPDAAKAVCAEQRKRDPLCYAWRMDHLDMSQKLIVAIDGPSGVGKGTIARNVAVELGYRHVDTGAMYRAVAWAALRAGLSLDDEEGVAAIARDASFDLTGNRTGINGRDVTRSIRTPKIDRAASAVARLPRVREILVDRQRALGAGSGIVMEGRDIGTVVFPDADVKIYLDATPEERARRRAADPSHQGLPLPNPDRVATVAAEMEERDRADKTRAASPLTIAADADVIDTTGLSIDEVTKRVLAIVRDRLRLKA